MTSSSKRAENDGDVPKTGTSPSNKAFFDGDVRKKGTSPSKDREMMQNSWELALIMPTHRKPAGFEN